MSKGGTNAEVGESIFAAAIAAEGERVRAEYAALFYRNLSLFPAIPKAPASNIAGPYRWLRP